MKKTAVALCVPAILLVACNDLRCRPGERKVASTCVPISAAADGSASMPPDASNDGDVDAYIDEFDGSFDPGGHVGLPDASPDSALQSCENEGQLRCAAGGTALRQRCAGGTWVDATPCAENEVCDPSVGQPGTCRALLDACRGSGGEPVCQGSTMAFCNTSGAAERVLSCKSERHCQVGLANAACAACTADEFRCAGAELEVCREDGSAFEHSATCDSAALCNAGAGACTDRACVAGTKMCSGDTLRVCNEDQTAFEDERPCGAGLCDAAGKECDVCIPSSRSCDGNNVRTCNAAGQGYNSQPCTAPRGICTGNGVCVECSAANDCPVSGNGCTSATCDAASGTCGSVPRARGIACRGGVCDGAGNCVECTDSSRDCASGEICEDNRCVAAPRCGDGTLNQASEQCEQALVGPWKCSVDCRAQTLYTPCESRDDCSDGEFCYDGLWFCTRLCSAPALTKGPESGCPTPPGGLIPMCSGGCVAIDCRTSADCALGMSCDTSNDVSICMGCRSRSDCPRDQLCIDSATGQAPTSGRAGFCQ